MAYRTDRCSIAMVNLKEKDTDGGGGGMHIKKEKVHFLINYFWLAR
jgi:hypothetical protein